MNGNDPLENRLRAIAPRQVPPEWRSEILADARNATASSHSMVAPSHSLRAVLASMFWPYPQAWARLAAAWVVIIALNLATRESGPPEIARQLPPPSPQLRQLLREQEQMLAELTGTAEEDRPVAVRPPAAQPRSERQSDALNA